MATPLPGWEREGPQGVGSGGAAVAGSADGEGKGGDAFDATQYAFFSLAGPGGARGLGEEELGGLDDGDDDDDDGGLALEEEEGIGESEELGGLEDEDEERGASVDSCAHSPPMYPRRAQARGALVGALLSPGSAPKLPLCKSPA